MTPENKISILESLLFAVGAPISFKKLAKVLDLSEPQTEKMLQSLADDYKENNRGLRLTIFDKQAQLVTAENSSEAVAKLIKSDFEEELSSAALETLAVIAYRGPVSRSAIENLRGVNCSFILQSLLIRGLIERRENSEDRRSYIYSVTFDFLKHLGLNGIEELPDYDYDKEK